MFAFTSLIAFFNIIVSPVFIISTRPVPAYPSSFTQIIINGAVDAQETKAASEGAKEEYEGESEIDSEDEASSCPSTIFSDEDSSDGSSLISVFSEESIYCKEEVEVKSAVPSYVFSEWDGKDAEKKEPATSQWVDDIDAVESYDARYLTFRAREQAEDRSRRVWVKALSAARKWATTVPLKAHEHPAPYSNVRWSALGGKGRSSPLRSSWVMEDLETDARREAALAVCWADEEDDVLEDLEDVEAFFGKQG